MTNTPPPEVASTHSEWAETLANDIIAVARTLPYKAALDTIRDMLLQARYAGAMQACDELQRQVDSFLSQPTQGESHARPGTKDA